MLGSRRHAQLRKAVLLIAMDVLERRRASSVEGGRSLFLCIMLSLICLGTEPRLITTKRKEEEKSMTIIRQLSNECQEDGLTRIQTATKPQRHVLVTKRAPWFRVARTPNNKGKILPGLISSRSISPNTDFFFSSTIAYFGCIFAHC